MVSSQADKIIAMPGSAVGSIGVITEIPNVDGLLDKLGVEFTVDHGGQVQGRRQPVPRAHRRRRPRSSKAQVDEVYEQFIDIVAEGRKMQRSEVESLATGWAWTGIEAKELGLVDEIGTYQDALEAAAKLGGIKGDYRGRPLRRDAVRHASRHAARHRESARQPRRRRQADVGKAGAFDSQVGRRLSGRGWSVGMSEPIVIAHISDLHCGSRYHIPSLANARDRRAQRARARRRGRHRRPHRHGLSRTSSEQAHRLIERIECERKVVLIGNHDARNVGDVHFEELFGARQRRARARRACASSGSTRASRISTPAASAASATAGSRSASRRPRRVQGRRACTTTSCRCPGTGRERNIVHDAGDLLRVLADNGVDLVLCGHKHVPNVWRLEDMLIVNAGTCCTHRLRGRVRPCYNVIEIRRRDRVRVLRKEPFVDAEIVADFRGMHQHAAAAGAHVDGPRAADRAEERGRR